MSAFVDDVDDVHRNCAAAGLDVTFPPTDMPWNVREMHVRHPDGQVFQVGKAVSVKRNSGFLAKILSRVSNHAPSRR
jgi:hypothetical protein